MMQPVRKERILHHVGCRVGGREGHRNDKVCCRKSEKAEAREAFPTTQERVRQASICFPARSDCAARPRSKRGALPNSVTRTRTRVATGERKPAAKKRDTRLIPKRREVIHSGQTHHLPPAMRMNVGGSGVRALQEPPNPAETSRQAPLCPRRFPNYFSLTVFNLQRNWPGILTIAWYNQTEKRPAARFRALFIYRRYLQAATPHVTDSLTSTLSFKERIPKRTTRCVASFRKKPGSQNHHTGSFAANRHPHSSDATDPAAG